MAEILVGFKSRSPETDARRCRIQSKNSARVRCLASAEWWLRVRGFGRSQVSQVLWNGSFWVVHRHCLKPQIGHNIEFQAPISPKLVTTSDSKHQSAPNWSQHRIPNTNQHPISIDTT